MRTVCSEEKCVAQIRKNMTAAGCSEEQISEAIGNYHKLCTKGFVEIACLV